MFNSLIVTLVLAQMPTGGSGAGETSRATQSQPSARRKAELQRLAERRKERRFRAAVALRQERIEALETAERLAPILAAQHQAEAARWHFEAEQARRSQMMYPYGYPWYPYSWYTTSRPILRGPFPQPTPQPAPLPVSSPGP